MTAKKILGSPQANLPTMRVAARALHRFGPMTRADLVACLRPPEYFDDGPAHALIESLTVAGWLGLLTEGESAVPKIELGGVLLDSHEWYDSPEAFALIVLALLLSGPSSTEVAELIPWFLAQDWRRPVSWNHDEFSRQRVINTTQANAFFDRWMIPLGLAKPSREAPDPTYAIRALLPSLVGRHSGARFVERLGETIPTGPAHQYALDVLVGEDAPQSGEVFPSVAFALLQLERCGCLSLTRDDDAAGVDRLIFRDLTTEGYSNVTHVEVLDV